MRVGIDIVSIERIKNIYKKFGYKFLYKIFTENEIKEIENLENLHRKIEKIAGKFAAKEAIMKIDETLTEFKEIEILTLKTGMPVFSGKKGFSISLSHEKSYAVAVAIYCGEKGI
jgi:phosphopantetheine--protein transferase-like protein